MTDQYGATVYIRFYDTTASLVWPDSVNAYYLNQGQTGSYGLACATGHQICYGASNADGSQYWGVGVNGDQACSACCLTCDGATQAVTLAP